MKPLTPDRRPDHGGARRYLRDIWGQVHVCTKNFRRRTGRPARGRLAEAPAPCIGMRDAASGFQISGRGATSRS